MEIEYDLSKRLVTLDQRGIDMADAGLVFENSVITIDDHRQDYGEVRYITFGKLLGRMVVLAWTLRNGRRRIISMRKANEREQKIYGPRLG
jgi:uncharacterized protein